MKHGALKLFMLVCTVISTYAIAKKINNDAVQTKVQNLRQRIQKRKANKLWPATEHKSESTVYTLFEIEDILPHLNGAKDTLVIFDIDNTLISACEEQAKDEWFGQQLEAYKKQGLSSEDAIKKIIPPNLKAHYRSDIFPVDIDVNDLMKALHQKGIKVVALTARSIPFVEITLKQLKAAHLNLSKMAPWKSIYVFTDLPNFAYYFPGVLFAGGNDKGRVLEEFLKKVKYRPRTILYVDDTEKHVKNVKRVVDKLGIDAKLFHFERLKKSPIFPEKEGRLCRLHTPSGSVTYLPDRPQSQPQTLLQSS